MGVRSSLVKDLSSRTPEEVLKCWAKVIKQLRASQVCYCPGRDHGREPEFETFLGALPLLVNCDALVYAEPRRSKDEALGNMRCFEQQIPIPIEGGCVTGVTWIDTIPLEAAPGLDRQGLFKVPATPWLPPGEQPAEDRFWGDCAELELEMATERKQRHVKLLQIGVGGLAAALYFFEPRRIKVAKIIGTAA